MGTNTHDLGSGRFVGGEEPTRDDHLATKKYVDDHGGGNSVDVTDGDTTVTGLTELDFTSGATVTDAGGGVAQVAIAGGSVPFVGVDPPGSPTDGMLWWDPDDNTAVGGSQPVKIVPVTVAFDGFTFVDSVGLTPEPIYTLQEDEQLLFTLGRVTEIFNDSLAAGIFVVDAENSVNFAFSVQTLLATDLPAASGGAVTIQGSASPGDNWNVSAPIVPESGTLPLYLNASGAGDGTAGSVTVWLYIGTP